MTHEDRKIIRFLDEQLREHAGKHEVEPGSWLLFAIPVLDRSTNNLAAQLLSKAPFPCEMGTSDDDQWALYFVRGNSRALALHWADNERRRAAGEVLMPAPEDMALATEIHDSKMPHRAAQRLATLHEQGEVPAGFINNGILIRSLLDRLHSMQPLYFSAFRILLENHLVDLVELLKQMTPEDVELENQIVGSGLSRDPFLQSRQDATAQIRYYLLRFHVINPLDQTKNVTITNPYSAYLEILTEGEFVRAKIDGNIVRLPRADYREAIHLIRRRIYLGGKFSEFSTQAPWITEETAYPFRSIKQSLQNKPDIQPLDGLFMLERAIDA